MKFESAITEILKEFQSAFEAGPNQGTTVADTSGTFPNRQETVMFSLNKKKLKLNKLNQKKHK